MNILKKKKESPLEVNVIEKKGVKVVYSEFYGKTFYIAISKDEQKSKEIGAGINALNQGGQASYKSEDTKSWSVFIKPENIPGFIPLDALQSNIRTEIAMTTGTQQPITNPNSIIFKKPDKMSEDEKRTAWEIDPIFGIDKCPRCNNIEIVRHTDTDIEHDETYFSIECKKCGWNDWSQ